MMINLSHSRISVLLSMRESQWTVSLVRVPHSNSIGS